LEKNAEDRPVRADARRNIDALLRASLEVFAISGVDAPVREIAERASVGVGTIYRHFPQRSDLIKAVFRQQIDACADAASALASRYPPGEALALWMQRYMEFIGAKRGLAAALHSGDPAYDALPIYFQERLRPALVALLNAATDSGEIRSEVDPDDLLLAVSGLCTPARDGSTAHTHRMVALLIDGLRFGAGESRRVRGSDTS
jgi:AcrR family transcriptional regulator